MASLLNHSETRCLPQERSNRRNAPTTQTLAAIRYVHHPKFDAPESVHNILETLPGNQQRTTAEGQGRLRSQHYRLPDRPLLSAETERALFLRMNLLRCMAARRQQQMSTGGDADCSLRIIRNLLADADDVRNEIMEANQRLVVSNASKFVRSGVPLADLVSEGNLALIKAVDAFDISRGYRLSTYATFAIRRHLSRYVQREQKRIPVQSDEPLDPLVDNVEAEWLDVHPGDLVNEILAGLPARERAIVQMRFGLTADGQPKALDQIAKEFGISKERVRQLIVRSCAEAFTRYDTGDSGSRG
ncbi:MAG: sigma-70 family RNA polymerase sigma factor [Planctomycetaceae bacterium]